jgi:hypothetical protein
MMLLSDMRCNECQVFCSGAVDTLVLVLNHHTHIAMLSVFLTTVFVKISDKMPDNDIGTEMTIWT